MKKKEIKKLSKDEIIKNISKKNYIYKSLRMSCMEIKLF